MMFSRRAILIGAAALWATSFLPAWAQTPRPNRMPDVLRRELERDPGAPVLGNPDGDVTLTEFFDYNCQFCRKMVGTVQRLIASDPSLRVVFRELPVFGQGSDFAARASLASLDQGKYWQFHTALLGMRGTADEVSVIRTAEKIGLDTNALRSTMDADRVLDHIATSTALADHMGLLGAPTFVAGDEALFGEQSLSDLQALVARARETLG